MYYCSQGLKIKRFTTDSHLEWTYSIYYRTKHSRTAVVIGKLVLSSLCILIWECKQSTSCTNQICTCLTFYIKCAKYFICVYSECTYSIIPAQCRACFITKKTKRYSGDLNSEVSEWKLTYFKHFKTYAVQLFQLNP